SNLRGREIAIGGSMGLRIECAFAVALSVVGTAYAQGASDPKASQSSNAQGSGAQGTSTRAPPAPPPPITSPPLTTAPIAASSSATAHGQEWADIAARLGAMDAKVSKLGEKKESPDHS